HHVDEGVRLPGLHLLHDLGGKPLEVFRGLVEQGVDGYLPVEPGGILAGRRFRQRVVLPQSRQLITGLYEAAAVHRPVLATGSLAVRVRARGPGPDLAVGDLAGHRLVRHIAGGRAGAAVAAMAAVVGAPVGVRAPAGARSLPARPEPAPEIGV